MPRRFALIVLLAFLPLCTGALEYLHDLEHEMEDEAAGALVQVDAGTPRLPPKHDETNCPVHAQLHMPILPVPWIGLLILLGLLVAFLTMLAPLPVMRRLVLTIDCRGPPLG